MSTLHRNRILFHIRLNRIRLRYVFKHYHIRHVGGWDQAAVAWMSLSEGRFSVHSGIACFSSTATIPTMSTTKLTIVWLESPELQLSNDKCINSGDDGMDAVRTDIQTGPFSSKIRCGTFWGTALVPSMCLRHLKIYAWNLLKVTFRMIYISMWSHYVAEFNLGSFLFPTTVFVEEGGGVAKIESTPSHRWDMDDMHSPSTSNTSNSIDRQWSMFSFMIGDYHCERVCVVVQCSYLSCLKSSPEILTGAGGWPFDVTLLGFHDSPESGTSGTLPPKEEKNGGICITFFLHISSFPTSRECLQFQRNKERTDFEHTWIN